MRDPFSWSVPLVTLFGIKVKVHFLFPLVALGLILRVAFAKDPYPPGTVTDAILLMVILFASVLLHEFGHCFGARLVDGDAQEVMLWPLGGLAALDLPHRPRAHFVAVAAGPLANLLVCVASAFFLVWVGGFEVRPPVNPLWSPYRGYVGGDLVMAHLYAWNGADVSLKHAATLGPVVVLARVFWMNWVLLLLNVLVVGFPLDGGRLLQSALWAWWGFAQATRYAVYAGFVVSIIIGIVSISSVEPLILLLAFFIFFTCRQQLILLETGGEDSLFGYDFSQGYTSLEGDAPPPRRRQSFWQRWLQRRALQKRQREQELREAEEQRMDALLEKVQQGGLASLTDEERRFLKRVSDRYRHR